MSKKVLNRIIQLSTPDGAESVRFLTSLPGNLHVSLQDGQKKSTWVTLTRTGKFSDPRYGEFEISKDMLLSMVENFNDRVYGQDIFIDVSHDPSKGAAATVQKLSVEGDRLRGLVEWTEYGIEAVKQRGFRYLSVEYRENYQDNEDKKEYGPLLMGAGLTTRPVIKRLEPVLLSESELSDSPTLLHPNLAIQIAYEAQEKMNKYLQMLIATLSAMTLSEPVIQKLSEVFKVAAAGLGDDEKLLQGLHDQFEETGKALSEQDPAKSIEIKIESPGGKTLSEDDINRVLDERTKKAADDAKLLAETAGTKRKAYTDLIEASGLDDNVKKTLSERAETMITADTPDIVVTQLAEQFIEDAEATSAAKKLADMGYAGPAGSVRISAGDDNSIKALQEATDRRLGITDLSEGKRYESTGGKLPEENKRFADKVLAQFDQENMPQLQVEHKLLAGGDGIIPDVDVPASFQRTVIREALYSLMGLQFVQASTDRFNLSYSIPFSYRDQTAAGKNNTRTFEGQGIQKAGVIQTSEMAYPIPQKLAFQVSDEVRYLTAAGHNDFEVVAENRANASRIIGEDSDRLMFNEVLQASDEYGAVAVTDENIAGGFDGVKTIFPLANWPVVHPRIIRDLKGVQIGLTQNPLVVNYDGQARDEFDGTGDQAAGIYFKMDYNHGEVSFVDEAGAPLQPNGVACTLSYSHSTNVGKFDMDHSADTAIEDHWNKFLYAYDQRKNVLKQDRWHIPNYGLMSGTIMTSARQARKFEGCHRIPGTDLSANGNLGSIWDVSNFESIAPGMWIGDQRVLLGERGTTRLKMVKPWTMGELENERNAQGQLTGQKQAYGDQFLVLHTPTPLRRATTSLVLFSSSERVAR